VSIARRTCNPSGMLNVCVLVASLVYSGCADPATQTQLNLELSGLNAAFNRGTNVGGVELEMSFVPTSATPSSMQRRIAPVGMSDTRMVTVQLPDGAYTLTARVVGRVNCGPGRSPVVVTLGARTVSGITVPSANPVRVAIESQSVPMTPCG
jgi:hypothetical protein